MTYRYSLSGELSQGDIFRRVRVIRNIVGSENDSPKYKESIVIVITRDCEIDKSIDIANSVHVARVMKLSSQSERMQELIRENAVVNIFYLPSDGQYMQESYIDWRTVQQVSKQKLYDLRPQQDCYVCTLEKSMMIDGLAGFRDFFNDSEEEKRN